MNHTIEFKNNISIDEFCKLRESVGFQELTAEQAKTVLANTSFLINQALMHLKEYSVSNVKLACSLYANPGKESFYEKFGFQKLPDGKYGYGMLVEL